VAVTFRVADAGDVPALAELIQSAYRGEESRRGWTTEADLLDGQRTDQAELADVVGAADEMMLVAVLDGAIVGCCRLGRRPDATVHLGMLSVRPSLQNARIGRAVVAEAERTAVGEWGAEYMELSVLRPRGELIAWYERLGYHPTGATSTFPYRDDRWGVPKVPDLEFVVLAKRLPRDVRSR
jgi:ribosomal protein S18 acetylase RimI-like enzyme